MVGLTVQDVAELEGCAGQLRAEGWASFVTYERLLAGWRNLSREVASYRATVDDYTNDLSSRTGLDQLVRRCHPATAARLGEQLAWLDEAFLAGTDSDESGLLARFYRIDESSGWWLRRIPKEGPLREYLDAPRRN